MSYVSTQYYIHTISFLSHSFSSHQKSTATQSTYHIEGKKTKKFYTAENLSNGIEVVLIIERAIRLTQKENVAIEMS